MNNKKYSNNDSVNNQVANQHSFVMLLALVHGTTVITASDDRYLDLRDEAGPHKGLLLTKPKPRATKGSLRYIDK